MGFFSYKTQDTNKSIANKHSGRPTFPVIMLDDRGNEYYEDDYDGYGVFGGKDYYELLAEMNGARTRDEGIDIALGPKRHGILYPALVEEVWGDVVGSTDAPEPCEQQGYFY